MTKPRERDELLAFTSLNRATSGGGTYYDTILSFDPLTEAAPTTLTSVLDKAQDDFALGLRDTDIIIFPWLPAGVADKP
ncbi:hypothetical protein ACWTU6_02020 [Mesorhizobium sp. BHbsci]